MIRRKLKTCSDCGQQKLLWSHGRCKECDAKSKPRIALKSKEATGEFEMFCEYYVSSDKRSFVSGTDLRRYEGTKLFVNLFHHVLNKKNYPIYLLEHKNIILLTPQEHLDIHSSSAGKLLEQNPNWEKYFNLWKQLQQKYYGREHDEA